MSFIEAVKSCFSKYACFKGRARRSEYWYFSLFNYLVTIAVTILIVVLISAGGEDVAGILTILYTIFSFAIILPGIAVSVRRLHDVGRSGAYLFFSMIPVVGPVMLLIWSIEDGAPGVNQYGPSPKYGADPVMSCPRCHAPLTPGLNFCTNCAYDLRTGSGAKPGKKCPGCGKENDPSCRFCTNCGHDLSGKTEVKPAGKICPDCGYESAPDAKFCVRCGHSFVPKDEGTVLICVNCGHETPPGSRCRFCGKNPAVKDIGFTGTSTGTGTGTRTGSSDPFSTPDRF